MTFSSLLKVATCALATSLSLAACTTPPRRETPLTETVPITAATPTDGVDGNSDKLFVVVTFSGGGKRAAAALSPFPAAPRRPLYSISIRKSSSASGHARTGPMSPSSLSVFNTL